MTKLYKLTDENGKTRAGHVNELQWGEGVTHTAQVEGTKLCTDQVIHAFEHPLTALFLFPLFCFSRSPRLWEAEGEVVVREGLYKCGVKMLTTVREIPIPTATVEQRIKFAILCVLEGYEDDHFRFWAGRWLSGEDRSEESAANESAKIAGNSEAASWATGAAWACAYAKTKEAKNKEEWTREVMFRSARAVWCTAREATFYNLAEQALTEAQS